MPLSLRSWCCLGVIALVAPAAGQAPAPPPAAPSPEPAAEPASAPEPAPAAPEPAPAEGPIIELAPEPAPRPAPAEAPSAPPQEPEGLAAAIGLDPDGTNIGGYAELHYSLNNATGPGDSNAVMDLRRMVLFVSHRFNPVLRFYSEFEVEHAIASPGRPGEVAVEQAFLDFQLLDQALGLRAGVILVPMGIINQWHEPPIFNGVERPMVDRVVIPTTWREGGLGIFGQPFEGVRYELYLMSGLDPTGFTAQAGIRGGRQAVSLATVNGLALTGRVEVEPMLGLVAGVSGYLSNAGPNADLFDAAGKEIEIDVPVVGVSADARIRRDGFEARAVGALFGIGDTGELRQAFDAEGNGGVDAGGWIYGSYGELAYDVLFTLDTEHQLLPFVRVERYDTMAEARGREETPADEALGATDLVFGLGYKPIPQVVFKTDFVLHGPDGPAESVGQFNLGLGLMF